MSCRTSQVAGRAGRKSGGLLVVLLLLAAGLSGACVAFLPGDFLSGFVMHPDESCVQLASELGLGSLRNASDPGQAGLTYEAFSATSADGQLLAGWFIPAQWEGQLDAEPAGTVMVLHGTSGAVACTLPWALAASANHMNAVVFDYQGYGDSGGAANIATLLEDGQAVLDWIVSDAAAARQNVHLIGVSLGTGPTLGLAVQNLPQVRSVTLDGAYDPEAMVTGVEDEVCAAFPLFGFSARLDFAWLFDTRSRLGQMSVPVLMIVAGGDTTTPPAGAETVYGLIGSSSKSLWLFEGLQHVQPLFLAESRYVSLLVTFWRDPAGQPSETAAGSDPTIRVPSFAP